MPHDLSSVPICDVDLPNIVYMIVDEKIELEIKYLKEYVTGNFYLRRIKKKNH